MSICDPLENWKNYEYFDRIGAIRDWVKEEAESWGIEPPTVVFQASTETTDAGEELDHYGSYDPESNTISIDPRLVRDDETYDPEDSFDTAAHELRHAMQAQYYGDEYDTMDEDELQEDAVDFADSYSEEWTDECEEEVDAESAPGRNYGDWNLPAGEGFYA